VAQPRQTAEYARHVQASLARPVKEGQSPLNPKVQGSTPCASTNTLCPRFSGRVSGVPDVSPGGWQLVANQRLTAYVTA
jgi:hypothetical protein